MNKSRPKLDNKIAVEDFKDFYWLKKELTNFCRKYGINSTGRKPEIAKRIEKYLSTGHIIKKNCNKNSSNINICIFLFGVEIFQ